MHAKILNPLGYLATKLGKMDGSMAMDDSIFVRGDKMGLNPKIKD